MKNNFYSQRGKIRLISFVCALVMTLTAWGTIQTIKTEKYAKEASVARQRTVTALASYIDALENDLRKMQYANTSTMTSGLALSLCKASAGAKNCLSELNAGETPLGNVNKFLTQASDYVQSLNKKISSDEKITDDDYNQLLQLYDYATKLSDSISYLEEVLLSGNVAFENAVSTLGKLSQEQLPDLLYSDAMTDAEKSFSDYPTLIYDGPFADNIMNKKSALLESEPEITASEAKKRAAAYSGIQENKLIEAGEEKGTIGAYVFYNEGTTVAVTKNGGYLLYILSDTFALEEKISGEDAVKIAAEFLRNTGYSSMKESYYATNDGICTINFAKTHEDAVCYADLIKVSVSLDKGQITGADCTGYIMNHRHRTVPDDTIGQSEAMRSISSRLAVKSVRNAFIPMENGTEVYAYEFLCSDSAGNDALIYIDALTGKEADIKLLLYSDGGTLTR